MNCVNITYLGHACFCLEQNGYRTVLDPYEDNNVPGLPPLRVEAEAVYCSHGHGDHNAVQVVSLQPAGAAPYTVEEFETPHDDQGGKLRGMNTVRIFNFGGIRVAHMGDVGRPLTEAEIQKLRGVDCLLIPVGGYFTIDAAQAKEMVEQIQPRVTIPMHFRTETSGYPAIGPVEDFTKRFPQVNYGGSTLALTQDTPKQVIVLKYNV